MKSNPAQAYYIYRCGESDETAGRGPEDTPYALRIWRPTLLSIAPVSLRLHPAISIFQWALHYCRLFGSRDYQVLLLFDGQRLVHHTWLVPANFRFPFMAAQDIQLSSVWTDPDYRGQGLATWAARKAMRMARAPGRSFWYVTRKENTSSIAVCTKAGFTLAAEQVPKRRLGMHIFHPIGKSPPAAR